MKNLRAYSITVYFLLASICSVFANDENGISIRRMERDDIESIVQYYSSLPVFAEDYDYPSEGIRGLLEAAVFSTECAMFSIVKAEAVEPKREQVVGFVRFREIKSSSPEILYTLSPSFWGSGVMTEAVRLSAEIIFKDPSVTGLNANVFPRNKGSVRVLEKSGFVFIEARVHKDADVATNEEAPINLYHLSREHFLEILNSETKHGSTSESN
jgi:ribosomal-protein-alanine N-acetyltransferase